jgi:hypothetical protein
LILKEEFRQLKNQISKFLNQVFKLTRSQKKENSYWINFCKKISKVFKKENNQYKKKLEICIKELRVT